MKYSMAAVVLFLLSTTTTTTTTLAQDTSQDQSVCHVGDDSCVVAHTAIPCHVYMAPSTIGVANMGIYTAVDLEPEEVVNYPDIAIPLLFRDWGYHGENPDGTLWDRYIWDHGVADIEPKQSDLEREDTAAVFVPGVGCTINSRLELNNIYSTHGSTYDTAGLHRSRDPAAGSFSPYHNSRTTAKFKLAAGTELFAAYGDTWIPDIPGAVITTNENMDLTDDFIDEYAEWIAMTLDEKASSSSTTTPTPEMDKSTLADLKEDLYTLTKEFPMPSPILGALPQVPWTKVEDAMLSSNTEITKSLSRHFIHEIGKRPVKWLQENGKCQDHLKPGRSTLAQAGRGAFAGRDLPKGTVVGYSPLVHIGDAREILKVNYQNKPYVDGGDYSIEDIIINYSFGHPNSSVLLTPYGAMVNYINHHRELANVKVVWPSKELVAHKPEWLSKDVHFLSNVHEKIGLSFDYIALRDIAEGEEIFMDYGDEWIAAWEQHVKQWKPVPGADTYVHSTEWNEPYLRTLEELSSNPYPPNLLTLCKESYRSEGNGRNVFVKVLRSTNSRRYCDVLERKERTVGATTTGTSKATTYYTYKVKMYIGNTGESVIVEDVPSPEGVELQDKLQSADWHLPNGFRHPITIPDDVLPESWKNK